MNDYAERLTQLVDELRHADGLITRLVAENEQLRAERDHLSWVVTALRERAEAGHGLSVVEGGRSAASRLTAG
ncbi:MAG: hypothetical protein ACRDZO_06410 [Egibacteraceae bacterium]